MSSSPPLCLPQEGDSGATAGPLPGRGQKRALSGVEDSEQQQVGRAARGGMWAVRGGMYAVHGGMWAVRALDGGLVGAALHLMAAWWRMCHTRLQPAQLQPHTGLQPATATQAHTT